MIINNYNKKKETTDSRLKLGGTFLDCLNFLFPTVRKSRYGQNIGYNKVDLNIGYQNNGNNQPDNTCWRGLHSASICWWTVSKWSGQQSKHVPAAVCNWAISSTDTTKLYIFYSQELCNSPLRCRNIFANASILSIRSISEFSKWIQ